MRKSSVLRLWGNRQGSFCCSPLHKQTWNSIEIFPETVLEALTRQKSLFSNNQRHKMLPSDIESTETTMTSQFMKNKKFFTEYSEHILNTFFEAESRYILIKKRSDQLEVRPMLIELLKKFSKHQQYSMATLHLGKKFWITDTLNV